MYRVDLRRQAQKSLDKLPKSDFQAVIEAIKSLAQMPRPRGIEKVKSTGLWRIRQGDYRIVYAIDDNEKLVTVVRVGHRREIYRAL
ncbi:MAG: type II toxin-antitoxin system RelE/ParE family toxin [Dehalococcoidales bacterium]|nr:type II toxin-antitoxin system RelE/ParE family toxin [Dehalococcoidales bacterium]